VIAAAAVAVSTLPTWIAIGLARSGSIKA